MDAVEFVKTVNRLCKIGCKGCPAVKEGRCMVGFDDYSVKNIEETVSKVEQWAKDNPLKTRQSEFLRIFPKAIKTEEGVLIYCPSSFDKDKYDSNCAYNTCAECRKAFWLTEVTNND